MAKNPVGFCFVRRSRLLYVDHIEHRGSELFAKACELDLEGIVAKRKTSLYRPTEKPAPHWIKIKNSAYSQAVGREEFFRAALDQSAAVYEVLLRRRLDRGGDSLRGKIASG